MKFQVLSSIGSPIPLLKSCVSSWEDTCECQVTTTCSTEVPPYGSFFPIPRQIPTKLWLTIQKVLLETHCWVSRACLKWAMHLPGWCRWADFVPSHRSHYAGTEVDNTNTSSGLLFCQTSVICFFPVSRRDRQQIINFWLHWTNSQIVSLLFSLISFVAICCSRNSSGRRKLLLTTDIVKNPLIPSEAHATRANIWAETLLEEHRVDILF